MRQNVNLCAGLLALLVGAWELAFVSGDPVTVWLVVAVVGACLVLVFSLFGGGDAGGGSGGRVSVPVRRSWRRYVEWGPQKDGGYRFRLCCEYVPIDE